MNTAAGMYIGSPYYSYRKALPDERKWQVGDVLYWNKGNHSFKFGVDTVHNDDLMNNTYESNGYESYSYFGNYINDLLNSQNGDTARYLQPELCSFWIATSTTATAVGTFPCYSSLVQGFGNPVFEIATMDTGIFAQDNWKFSPRLTLELGLRWDYEALPAPISALTTVNATSGSYFYAYPGLTNNPSDKMNFGPRIGFSYDVTGKGKTVVRGGYGVYYGRITNGNLLNSAAKYRQRERAIHHHLQEHHHCWPDCSRISSSTAGSCPSQTPTSWLPLCAIPRCRSTT